MTKLISFRNICLSCTFWTGTRCNRTQRPKDATSTCRPPQYLINPTFLMKGKKHYE